MKLNIVKDKAGKVIATYEKAQGGGPHKRLLNRALFFAFASVWILRGAWRYLANW